MPSETYGFDPGWTTDLGVHHQANPASLQGVLASIPGLSSYLAMDQYLRQRNQAERYQPQNDEMRQIALETKRQELEKQKRDNVMSSEIQNMISGGAGAGSIANPEVYRALALKMGLAGRVGGSAFATEADRMDKLAQEKTALAGMRSAPEIPAVGEAGPNIPAAAKPGEVSDELVASPYVGRAAGDLRRRINEGGLGMTSAKAEESIKNLWSQHNQMAQRVDEQAARREAPTITGDTLEMDAWRYLTDGTLPPNMGRGAQGASQATAIRNRSSELAKEMGMDPSEIRFGNLTNKAAVSAISQLGRARAQILQFEKTAMANADIALAQSDKTDRSGVPLVNKYLLSPVKTHLLNDPEFLKLHNATETFISEYARVMGGGYGAAQTTEGAQQRAHTLLNAAHTKEQFESLIGTNGLLRKEMRNREKSLNDQMEEEKRRLRGGLPVRPSAPSTPSAPNSVPSQDLFNRADAILNGGR